MTSQRVRVFCVQSHKACPENALDQAEFTCQCAQTLSEAEKGLRDAAPDAIVLHLPLEGEKDFEPIPRIRIARPDCPIVIVLSPELEPRAAEAIRAGAQAIVWSRYADGQGIGVAVRHALERWSVDSEYARIREWFDATFESSTTGVVIMGPDGKRIKVNQAFCKMVGRSEEELYNEGIYYVSHKDDHAAVDALIKQMKEGTLNSYQREKKYLDKEGGTKWGLLNVSTVRDSEGKLKYIVSQVQDITDRKRLEENVRQAQKMEAIGRLAGGVAHDFNNLLTAITGYSELLIDRFKDDPATRADLEQILKSSQRGADLTRQLLEFGRRQLRQVKVLEINQVLDDMRRLLQSMIGENIILDLRTRPNAGTIKADPTQIEQIMINLALNARDAMPQGGELIIETDRATPSGATKPYTRIQVTDTGSGMDETTREHIFEPFFTTKKEGEGTGLGLASVYGIVKQSGGDIQVTSKPERGTTFSLYFPRISDTIRAGRKEGPGVKASGGSESILLVEDDEMVRNMTRRVLERKGYHVFAAANADEAVGISEKVGEPIDLLVTDVVMPGRSGTDLAQALKVVRPDMKVLYISGFTASGVIRRGLLVPGSTFLQKPFRSETLLRKVRELLDPARDI